MAQVQDDHVTTEILGRNLGWPYVLVMDNIVKPCFNTVFWVGAHLWDRVQGKQVSKALSAAG